MDTLTIRFLRQVVIQCIPRLFALLVTMWVCALLSPDIPHASGALCLLLFVGMIVDFSVCIFADNEKLRNVGISAAAVLAVYGLYLLSNAVGLLHMPQDFLWWHVFAGAAFYAVFTPLSRQALKELGDRALEC